MNHRGYASTSASVRGQLEKLIGAGDDSAEWLAFLRRETTLPPWILPAVQIAVRQGAWRGVADPVAQITFAVRRIAMDLKLGGNNKIAEIQPEGE
jgi:hypothetical protein